MAVAISSLSQHDQEVRKGRVTGTRIVKLVDGRGLEVFNDMMGLSDPIPQNARMRAGVVFERPMIEWAASEKGWSPVVYQPGTAVSKKNDRHAASVDAMIPARLAVEGKFRGADQAWKYEDGPTEAELTQVTWEAGVLDLPETAIVVCIGGNDLRVYESPFDADLYEGLTEIANKFLRDHIDTGRPPPLDHTDAAATYLRKKFPRDVGPVLQGDEVVRNLVMELKASKADLKADEERVSRLENQLKDIIGTASGIEGPGYRVSWKATKDVSRVDWEGIAAHFAPTTDLIQRFTVSKPGPRRFTVSFREEK